MFSNSRLTPCLALAALALLAGCGGGSGNAAPRLTTIPSQTTPGGTAFTLDLSAFVTDREASALSYQVTSGGGSFTGSVYSNTFATLGTYTVAFSVMDIEGKTATGTFTVKVTTAVLALVQAGTDLALLDTGTNNLVEITNTLGVTYTYKAALSKGHVVFERTFGGRTALYVFNPNTTQIDNLGNSASYDYSYRTRTSDNKIVFTRTSVADPTDSDLFIWDPATSLTREISAGAGVFDGTPVVNSGDLVFYERSSGGQRDIYYYDPSEDTSVAVSTNARHETLQAALPNGGVVFTRIGDGGETDLHYFKVGTGVVEIGADLGATVLAQTKTYGGATSNSLVAFQVTAASQDMYAWNPSTGSSRVIATTGVDETFAAVNSLDEIVFNVATSGTNNDLRIYSWTTDTTTTISSSADNDVFEAVIAGTGDVVWRQETGTGHDLLVWDASALTGKYLANAGTDNYSFDAVLGNGKVVYTRAGGSGGVYIINPEDLVVDTVSAVAGASYGGVGPATGDVVAVVPVSGQDDLVMWDESAGSVVSISSTTGDDAYGAGLSNGKVVFTRIPTGQTTKDLFIWDQVTTTSTRLTTTSDDHAVVTAYSADNS